MKAINSALKSIPRPALATLAIIIIALSVSPARATYIATLNQVGTDVVGTGSGSLDISQLTGPTGIGAHALVLPAGGFLQLGPTGNVAAGIYGGFSGPTSFGAGLGGDASLGGGDLVGIRGNSNELFVPGGYLSGTPLASTDTWSSHSFATLGVTPGTYTWTWGTGAHADSFILYAGVPVPSGVPDTGNTLMLLLFGLTATCGIKFLQHRPA